MDLKTVYKGLLIICVLHFGLFIQTVIAQKILKGPYLIEPGESSMLIRWEMDAKSDYKIAFGLSTLNTSLIKLNN
ncbi:MAG: hypothetical protein DRI89_10880, partial [Bacteroidetes bacterium]